MVEEVKALPETLVLIMEGGPSGAEGLLEALKVKAHRRQTGCTGTQGGHVTLKHRTKLGRHQKSCDSFHMSICERQRRKYVDGGGSIDINLEADWTN